MSKKLHPSVQKFKEFVKKNPHLINEVKQGTSTWQELYEEWYLLGEDDSRWGSSSSNDGGKKEEKSSESDGEIVGLIWNRLKKMDPNQLQSHISSLSEAIGAVQGILSQFQGNKNAPKSGSSGPSNPFSFRKD
ncbi:YlbD family protein [Bacillus carboniphilus]|uniref:YlbD family protein n=1 Tax=Bacillus carboniphilus TaxID=86663 RepID=A0ABN0WIB2_9BACI